LIVVLALISSHVTTSRLSAQRIENKDLCIDSYGDPLPKGCVARLGTHRLRHSAEVKAVTFSHNGKVVISVGRDLGCDRDRSIYFWEADTGKRIRAVKVEGETWITSVVACPGRDIVASGTLYGSIDLWEISSGKHLFRMRLDKELNAIQALAFSPDGKFLVSGSEDGTVCLWTTATGTKDRVLGKHSDGVGSLAFSPDNKQLASGGKDKRIKLWNLSSGKLFRELPEQVDNVTGLAFCPDGKRFISGYERNAPQIWDVASWRMIEQVGKSEAQAGCFALSPTGKVLATGAQDGVYLWDVNSGKQIRVLKSQFTRPVYSLAFGPDGKMLASLHNDHAVALWECESGKERSISGHRGEVTGVTFTADSKVVMTAGDMSVRSWEVSTGKELWQYGITGGWVLSMSLSPDGRTLATGSSNVSLFDVQDRKAPRFLPVPNQSLYYALAFSHDGKILATGGTDQKIRLWDVSSAKQLREYPSHANGRTSSLMFASGSKFLASAGDDGLVCLWDSFSNKEIRRLTGHDSAIHTLALSGDGKLLASGHADGAAVLWDVATGKTLYRFAGEKPGVFAIAFSPNGSLLATGGNEIDLWEVVTYKKVNHYPGHLSLTSSLAFSPDGLKLVSGSHDTTALIWSIPGRDLNARHVLKKEELTKLWCDLAGEDAANAHQAIWALVLGKDQSVSFLDQHLVAVPPPDKDKIKQLIADLDNNRFTIREEAVKALRDMEELAHPALKKAMEDKPSPQVRQLLQQLLDSRLYQNPKNLQAYRAIVVLEQIGTVKSTVLLEKLQIGCPEARLTQEARAALKRLNKELISKP
jgi:WD40 repeat protein